MPEYTAAGIRRRIDDVVDNKRIILDPKEAQLREEIHFWQDLIADWEKHTPGPVPERMRDALALAMYRLELFLADDIFFENDIPPHGPQMNTH